MKCTGACPHNHNHNGEIPVLGVSVIYVYADLPFFLEFGTSQSVPPGALIDQVDLRTFLVMDASSDIPSECIDGYTS